MAQRKRSKGRADQFWYLLLASFVGMMALAGYAGYLMYPRFDLPAVAGIGLLALAVGAGIASFFSPCSFPLLATLLGHASHAGSDDESPDLMRSLRYASALAVGAIMFLGLIGLGIAAGASTMFGDVTFTSIAGRLLRVGMGGLLIALGLLQFGVISRAPFDAVSRVSAPLMRRQAELRRHHPTAGFTMFGFIYVLAGFG